MSTSSALPPSSLVAGAITEKLTRTNHAIWKAQVQSAVCGAQLYGHLTGDAIKPAEQIDDKGGHKVPNPAFVAWDAKDNQILSFLFASVSREIMIHIAKSKTAAEA